MSVWAVVWRRNEILEQVFLHGGNRSRREKLPARRCSDDGEELQFRNRGPWNVYSLGVGPRVRWGKVQTGVVDQVIEEGDVGGGEAFEEVATAKGDAQPEPFGTGTREKCAADEALGV
jgi:hypothetical protein